MATHINLNDEITHQNIDSLRLKILNLENSSSLKLHLRKRTIMFFSSTENIINEYLHALFIGERLSRLAKHFKSTSVDFDTQGEFIYELKKIDKIGLMNFFELLLGLFDEKTDDEIEEVLEEIDAFIFHILPKNIMCKDIYFMYQQAINMREESDE